MNVRRILTPSSLICAVLFLLVIYYVGPLTAFYYTKWHARNAPEMWIVPTPLRDVSIDRSEGRRFSYFGYEFESPWTEVKRERKLESIAIINFSGGQFVSIFDPAQSVDELQVMKQEAAKHRSDIRNVFGDEATRSNYALRSKILNLTPRDLRLFSSRQEIVGSSVLLIMKSIWTARTKGGLYSFETKWLRGFQEGGPAQDDAVIIQAFDAQDHEIQVWIGSEHGARTRPSQADINRILYSLRPVPAPSSKGP